MNSIRHFRINFVRPIVIFAICFSMMGCEYESKIDYQLNDAEKLMEERPDSALELLNKISDSDIKGSRRKARYALLRSIALDKNYIDTTNFDVLQPAIDYYLENGSPDEKLKTYYYQGIIHSNAGDDNLAMQSYLKGVEIDGEISDSLTLARLLVAQSTLFYKQYRILDFIENNIRAANVYKSLSKTSQELRCFLRVLDGEIILHNKDKADSVASICKALIKDCPSLKKSYLKVMLIYEAAYGSDSEIREIINEVIKDGSSNEMNINLAQAYASIGDFQKGLDCLKQTNISPYNTMDSLSYWSVTADIMGKLGDSQEALNTYRKYIGLLDKCHFNLFSNGLLFSEKQHQMELESLIKVKEKDNLLKLCGAGILLLMCLGGLFYYKFHFNKAARIIAEQNADNLRLETANLRLESDNLRLEFDRLEEEHHRLTLLLEQRQELAMPVKEAIRKRLDMLNSLLATEISSNEAYAKPYLEWIDSIRNDRKDFMNSTRMVFQASHPEFIDYLSAHGLTEDEINYVCLYAIGLRGKEIGDYIQLKRHYNISSDIRSKLGIDGHSTNLGPYIRQLMKEL